jgi:probable F420-dependent oxidoreductase
MTASTHPAVPGLFGAWLHPSFDDPARVTLAAEAEQLGYQTVWLGLGRRDASDLRLAERILDATEHVTVATGIVNMWTNDAALVARSFHRLEDRHPGRFLLGVGVGHPESVADYRSPYASMVAYIDSLDAAGVPADRRVLAALGPKALRLSAERTAGTHPYLTVPAHTRAAREILGQGPLLAPEHKVVVTRDATRARDIGRAFVADPYLRLSNYTNNLLRLGYTPDDIADGGSDRLIDDLVLHGEPEAIAAGLHAHLSAGADHVAIQVLTEPGGSPMPGLRNLAAALLQ